MRRPPPERRCGACRGAGGRTNVPESTPGSALFELGLRSAKVFPALSAMLST
jgi:hypothetical protein